MIRIIGSPCIRRGIHLAKKQFVHQNMARSPTIRMGITRTFCSSEPVATDEKRDSDTQEPLYVGTFGGILRLLRRVSLASATLSVTSLVRYPQVIYSSIMILLYLFSL